MATDPCFQKTILNKKVFNPFLNKYLFSPRRCGWDEARVYFPVKCFDSPLVGFFFPLDRSKMPIIIFAMNNSNSAAFSPALF